jgi:hypothetical protein
MSKSNTLENSLLLLFFNGTTIANIADNAASSPLTNLYVSLHTADPGEAGTAVTSEATYTGYLRVAVPRTSGGWTVTNNSVSPVANIDFPACSAGTNTITHFGIVSTSAGAGTLYYKGTVTPNISVSSGVTPRLTTASTITED